MVYHNHHYIAQIEPASHRNYPLDIQELIKYLTGARATVKDLTARLKAAQNECHRLESGWHKYSSTLSPIRACPIEILSMIFWFYLSENQHWVRRLQLVCRQWHDIVINDPQLWNRIYIKVPDLEWDMKSISHSAKKHTQMCLRRTGASLLDVKLDCDELRSTYHHTMNKIKEPFAGMFIWKNPDAGIALENWMDGLDVDALDIPAIMGISRPEHILSAIKILVGNQRENMGRFGSLELTLPRFDEEKLSLRLWKRFNGPTPSLTRLVIASRCSGLHKESTDEELAGSFPCLSALKHLDVDRVRIFKSLTLEPSSIESLVIHESVGLWAGYGLPRFSCLQYLELFGYYHSEAPNETMALSLPLLRKLTLNGTVQHLNKVHFQTPILQDFNILGRVKIDRHDKHNFLPDIQSFHVCWKGYITYSREGWIHEDLLKEMKMVTGHFDKARELTVSDFARTALIETVQFLHQGGELSSALEMIRFQSKKGAVETIEVRTLLLPNSS